MCQPVHNVAKKVTDDRKSLPERVLASPQVGGMSVGVVRPKADAPYLVKRAGFS